ncbi:hypothetical protein HMPREF3156_02484 [Neisseria sp. HMSC06F02]|nr:hypothetical protein HMPREF3156_02484 [Neisseria sp. HMSC06F02]
MLEYGILPLSGFSGKRGTGCGCGFQTTSASTLLRLDKAIIC